MDQGLYVDVGNSCLKWACATATGLGPMSRLAYSVESLPQLLDKAWQDLTPPQHVMVANVAGPAVVAHVAQWVRDTWGLTIGQAHTADQACGVRNGYPEAETLGVDRWLSLIAAHRLLSGVVCIFDCGTAMTMDVIDESGEHLGGQITPGMEMMKSALVANTQAIGAGESDAGLNLLAKDTASAVAMGCSWTTIAYMERMTSEIQDTLQRPLQVIVTGGGISPLLPYLSGYVDSGQWRYEPDWVLRGLQILAGEGP
jgi:type III pantothenate kinase